MSWFEFLVRAPVSEWIRFGLFLTGILLFIGIAEKTRLVLKWSPEINRKLVHILTGVLIFFSPCFFESNRPLVWMAVLFIILDFWAVKTRRLPGMHGTRHRSYGTVFYPLSFLILVVLCWPDYQSVLVVSMAVMAFCDAAAAVIGENIHNPHEYRLCRDTKSLEGSAVMGLSTLIVVSLLLPAAGKMDQLSIGLGTAVRIAAVTAVMATVLEALSSRGSDNLSVPLGSAFVIHFFLTQSPEAQMQFAAGMVLAGLVAFLSYRARFLSASGSAGTFILATLIFGVGGWTWSVPILTFFLLSSLLSEAGKTHKKQFGLIFEKSGRRDIGQVLSNGGMAGILLLAYSFRPSAFWYALYLGALAAANADTWATEIGVFSRIDPRSIVGFHTVPAGTSGGITLLGTLSALAGSLVIALSGWLAAPAAFGYHPGRRIFWAVTAAGFLASLVDSILGATLQSQYRCAVCGKITEKRFHCQQNPTQRVTGLPWLDNDRVNAICSISGSVFVWILTRF
ncbi:MAG TPA: DUF92 domain-containing protein [bacterium]|nr:DUF92 domain-containing protein [bacterium]